ncbi:methylenetetrahydrofolate reductase [NAD(P)H] [Clostridium sp. Marseille-P299]|uniref:methylenetetrahydrofolate reductase [NAD(P)H] n=1 Tax=Clostridium sp. Marseille-P299 TaxID=1805477 RepID=UPI00083431F3|nr:methylenetetrahydrofolate reductase [NAD(P)H] [Clostridium sp. Marseille-P299]
MIKDTLAKKKKTISIEVFPPNKEEEFQGIYKTLEELVEIQPDFISVTYGAGGSNSKKTAEIASYIKNDLGIDSLAHLTCTTLDESNLMESLDNLKIMGIENILALRGDKPKDMALEDFLRRKYTYASDMISDIRLKNNNFCIAGACYPEKHVEAKTMEEDILHLKEKVDAGTDFLITQLFFENSRLYEFLDKTETVNIKVPIIAGIMPITSIKQIKTTIEMSNAYVPLKLKRIFEKYQDNPSDFKKAGIDFAILQILDLLSQGVSGIHLYTMNKVDVSKSIYQNIFSYK